MRTFRRATPPLRPEESARSSAGRPGRTVLAGFAIGPAGRISRTPAHRAARARCSAEALLALDRVQPERGVKCGTGTLNRLAAPSTITKLTSADTICGRGRTKSTQPVASAALRSETCSNDSRRWCSISSRRSRRAIAIDSMERRCARWLLLTHDRVGADELSLSRSSPRCWGCAAPRSPRLSGRSRPPASSATREARS